MIDLHIHTTCSDGQFSPEETIRMAHQAGVTVAAVTDHDTVSGIVAASAAAVVCGMTFFRALRSVYRAERNCIFWDMAFIPTAMCCTSSVPSTPLTGQSAAAKCLPTSRKKAQPLRWKMCAAATRGKPPGDRISPERW